MTYENLINKIAELIVARRNAHGNDKEQQRINKKLEKLYKIKQYDVVKKTFMELQ